MYWITKLDYHYQTGLSNLMQNFRGISGNCGGISGTFGELRRNFGGISREFQNYRGFHSLWKSLTSLDLSYNQLDSVPFVALKELRSLQWINLHGWPVGEEISPVNDEVKAVEEEINQIKKEMNQKIGVQKNRKQWFEETQ
ncbi:hypothetical protein NQ315_004551 [Exocentrus adspersus]|uniref:Uncharacterized protein n=1 Tax=Exocentrus adspersus TaxID=1586481 RepID=A0AAV8VNB1_9CUCU|nr:hypothetical protein NQ315_004551 [Exocentrus adspersus]